MVAIDNTVSVADLEVAAAIGQHGRLAVATKRTIDIVVASTTLLLLWPLMLVIALLVKLTSSGPVLFSHDRVGKDGVPFRLYKFRTMHDGAHHRVWSDPFHRASYVESGFKLASHSKEITRFGRLLRRSSLDELPQLFNVLNGEMSIVGIRPLLEPELDLRPHLDQRLYMTMKPGMTGLWQVEGRSLVAQVERIALDRQYVEMWSTLDDIAIIMRTPAALLRHHETA